jgi:type VI secretion system secreted protein VgrG
MVFKAANKPRFHLELSAPGGKATSDELNVLGFTVVEKLSTPFVIDLEFASETDFKLDGFVGHAGCLSVLDAEGDRTDRYFHGIVSEFGQAETRGRFFLYRAQLVPSLWLLSLRRTCRIFQEKTIPDIVEAVLKDARIPNDTFEFRLQGKYDPCEYCVQYRETDLDFISRLLESEGIFYFFEHFQDKHVLVFGDGPVNYKPLAGHAGDVVEFNPAAGMAPQEDVVLTFDLRRQLHSQRVKLKDYNFKKPSLDLTCQQEKGDNKALEVYDYPGYYGDTDTGKERANVRLQEAATLQDRALGTSTCARFVPGFTFKLKEHDRQNIDGEYLLVELRHKGKQPQSLEEHSADDQGVSYANQILAIPSSVPFRPECRTPPAKVKGAQTAIVVGPEKEEIYTDEYGRIKVQFHWDLSDTADDQRTCWIRVCQSMAGPGWGAMFIPRVGHEVLVDFLEGDPDRPVIVGQFYHGANQTPYKLPDNKTVTTLKTNTTPDGGGFNEIRFEDKKGEEQVFLNSQGNLDIRAQVDRFENIGNDRHLVVKKNKFDTIEENNNLTVNKAYQIDVGGNRGLTIGADDKKEVSGKLSLKVGGDVGEEFNGSHSEKTAGNVSINAGGKVVIEAGSNITLKVGGSFISIESGGITVKTPATLELMADASAEMKGAASAKVESSGVMTVKGSLVQIN